MNGFVYVVVLNCGLGSDSLLSIAIIFGGVLRVYRDKESFNLLRLSFVSRCGF